MTSYFVSRHPGALEWAAEEGIQVDRRIVSSPSKIRSGN